MVVPAIVSACWSKATWRTTTSRSWHPPKSLTHPHLHYSNGVTFFMIHESKHTLLHGSWLCEAFVTVMRKVVNAYRNLLREKGEMDSLSLPPSQYIFTFILRHTLIQGGVWPVHQAMIENLSLLSKVGNVTTAVQEKNPVFWGLGLHT